MNPTSPSESEFSDDVSLIGKVDAHKISSQAPRQYESGPQSHDDEDEDDQSGLWGSSKRDYHQDDVDSDEDALEEEQEARRIQQKRLQRMSAADFGFDGNDWLENRTTQDGQASDLGTDEPIITEVLPQLAITDAMSVDERIKILHQSYPEFGPLSEEFLSLQSLHAKWSLPTPPIASNLMHSTSSLADPGPKHESSSEDHHLPTSMLKYQALTAYLGVLSMYFALLTSKAYENGEINGSKRPSELRDHAIMESLMACRDMWERTKQVRVPDPGQPTVLPERAVTAFYSGGNPTHPPNTTTGTDTSTSKPITLHNQRRIAQERAQASVAQRQLDLVKQSREELARLSEITSLSKVQRAKGLKDYVRMESLPQGANGGSDFGEDDILDPSEAADKARKKKSLRFYTSQITQKANRRDQAGKDAGGDVDLPYRERIHERQNRLNAQAESRRNDGLAGNALAQSAIASDDGDTERATTVGGGNASDEEYYEMVASSSRKRKLAKRALEASLNMNVRQINVGTPQESIGEDGKRGITYAIEKNKGLAPKRSKDVRNPRVKKRKKYAEKQKKLASVRQIYKGGEGRGGYGGEATGIKTRLVKSVKL